MYCLQGYLKKNRMTLWKNGTETCKHSPMVPPLPEMGTSCFQTLLLDSFVALNLNPEC